jgi:ankyrin repeat protein
VAWKTLVSSLDYRFRSGRQPIVAYQVAVSQCLQLGCELDENELVTWVYVAARGGHPQASWIAPLLERSCAKSSASILGDLHYSMVCLAIGACIGSVPSLLALKQADLGMYQSTLALIQSRERPDFQLKSTIELFKDFLDAPRLDMSTCSLMDAIKSQNVDRARALLESHSTDTTNMFDREGFNVLHALTLLEDDDAASLALSVYVHGANLLGVATLSEPTAVSLYARHIEGTPLYWTAIKGMPRLFKVLLELHVESSTPVIDPLRMAMQAAMLHHHEILYQILAQRDITPEAFLDDRSFGAEQLYIQALLGASLTPADIIPFSRRLLHGRNVHVAQRQTLNIVLARGADVFEPCFGFEDFTEGSGGYTGVSLAISNDDDRALKLFLGHLQASKVEVGNLEAMSSILQLCTVKNALRCFRVVLDTFPQLVNFLSTKDGLSPTLTPLNMAARRPRSDYALALLEREADTTICHEDFSPLARAILDGHLETAEVIYSFGYNEVTGFTLMGRVMSAWIATQKSKPLIDIVKWINDKGGAMLECDIVHKTPVWNMILSKRASSAADQAHLDDMMMATLFDLFPDKLDQPDPGGLYPLHHATMNGHRTAISLLLDRNVNIDCESTGLVVPEGMTPLTCAALRLETDAPSDVSKGGRLEVRMWRARMREILQFLLSKGATIGKHPRPGDFYRSLQYMVPGVNCFNASGNDPDPDDEMNWPQDTWPLKLPRDETSSEESAREGRTNFERGLLRNRGEYVKRMTDEEKQDLAQYGAWLLRKAKVRHERYNKFGIDWAGEDEELGDLPLSWQPWHSLLPLVGIVNQGRSWLM